MSHPKRLTQSSDVALTAVLQYILINSMEYSYYCLWVFHEGVAKIKKTVIYENHADSRESFFIKKNKENKNEDKFNVTQLHNLGYFSI